MKLLQKFLGSNPVPSTILEPRYFDNRVLNVIIDFKDDEYVVRVTRSVQEACQLVESGFEYVTEMEEVKIFRKRK